MDHIFYLIHFSNGIFVCPATLFEGLTRLHPYPTVYPSESQKPAVQNSLTIYSFLSNFAELLL